VKPATAPDRRKPATLHDAAEREPVSDQAMVDPRYVEARRVLLDALIVLAPHAIVVAGAQAVYLRTGAGDLPVAPYTADGDLVVDPTLLSATPVIESAMVAAGFRLAVAEHGRESSRHLGRRVGHRRRASPDPSRSDRPGGPCPARQRRAARLGPHGNRTARRAPGLEAALVGKSPMTISALDPATGDRSRPSGGHARAAGRQGAQAARPDSERLARSAGRQGCAMSSGRGVRRTRARKD
jgi:hypothetical protein